MRPIYSGLSLGCDLPDFCLPDTNGVVFPKDHLLGSPAILVVFMNTNNFYVKHVQDVFVKIAWEYQQKGVSVIVINSSERHKNHDNSLQKMKEDVKIFGFTFPYLFDETQETAKLFKVYSVPDFYLFNKYGKLVYHGQMDDSRPGNDRPVTGKDLRDALNTVLMGQIPSAFQYSANGNEMPQNLSVPPGVNRII